VNTALERSRATGAARSRALRAALLLAVACAGGDAGSTSGGEILVELYSGFSAGAPALPPARTHFVVDVSQVLPEGSTSEEEQRQLVEAVIAPYLAEHAGPGFESAALHPFRRESGPPAESCADRSSGSSLAASSALARLDEELVRSGGEESRVVLVAALEGECAPSLCEAAERLAQRGSWIDVAALGGDAGMPACLGQLRPSTMAPIGWLPAWSKREAPTFSVESVPAAGSEPVVLARGVTGMLVRAPAGVHRVRVALDPPELIGPLQLRPGQRLRIRIMDFPLSAPGPRAWDVETVDAGS
jgi:hypothetical protein